MTWPLANSQSQQDKPIPKHLHQTTTPTNFNLTPFVTPNISAFNTSSNEIHVTSLPLIKYTSLVRQPTYFQEFHYNFVLHANHVSHNHISYPLSYVLSYQHYTPSYQAFGCSISTHIKPNICKQSSQFDCWNQAMKTKLLALDQNQTWSLVDIQLGKSIVGCMWVYKIKNKADDNIERHKTRLVANGYTYMEGVDYLNTFSLVAKLTTITVLLALVASNHWKIEQLNVNNAFLHNELNEEVYMTLPNGHHASNYNPHKVINIQKSIYHLKQESRQWYSKLSQTLLILGYKQS